MEGNCAVSLGLLEEDISEDPWALSSCCSSVCRCSFSLASETNSSVLFSSSRVHSSGFLSSLNCRNIGALIIFSCVQSLNFTSATSLGSIQIGARLVYGIYSTGQFSIFIC